MRTELKRQIRRVANYVLIALAGLYAVDWAIFEARQLRGGGMGSVTVQKFLSTPLKGEKTEFDYLGTENDNCSQSLFPQYAASAWNPPCWWLARHKVKWVVTWCDHSSRRTAMGSTDAAACAGARQARSAVIPRITGAITITRGS